MTYEEAKKEACAAFLKNPVWAARYEGGKSNLVKSWFEAEFTLSHLLDGDENKKKAHEELKEIEKRLSNDDICYLHSVLKSGMSQMYLSRLVAERDQNGRQ